MNEIDNTRVHTSITVIAVTVLVTISAFVSVTATAALAAPKGIFAPFAQCPTSIPGVALCQYEEITSGEFDVGQVRVPIDNTIVFQGGTIPTGSANFNEYFLLPAANGETLSLTELNIPGGLQTILGCHDRPDQHHHHHHHFFKSRDICEHILHHRVHNEVTATVEGAATPTNPAILNLTNIIEETGTALTFPVKIHLESPFLGEECYLGSETHPIELHLTDGTTSPPPPNQPITGSFGVPASEIEEGYERTSITGESLVDNAFSIPPVEGCGDEHMEPIIDQRINQALGLESPAGHNTVIINGTHKIAEAGAVLASEKFPTKEESSPPPSHHHHHWWPVH